MAAIVQHFRPLFVYFLPICFFFPSRYHLPTQKLLNEVTVFQ